MTRCHGLIGSRPFETNIMSSSSRAQSCVGSYYQVEQCHIPAEVTALVEVQCDLSLLYCSVIVSRDTWLFSYAESLRTKREEIEIYPLLYSGNMKATSLGRSRLTLEDNIKWFFGLWGCGQDSCGIKRVEWRAVVNTMVSLRGV